MTDRDCKKIAVEAYKSGKLSGTWKRDELMAVLQEIRKKFSWKEKKTRTYLVLWLSLIASVILLIITISSIRHDVAGPVLFFVSAAAIIALVAMIVVSIRKSLRLFVNSYEDFTLFVNPFLELLGEDIMEGSDITLDLELKDIINTTYLKDTSEAYVKGKYFKCVDRFYDKVFMTLKATMHDGNKLFLSVRDYCKESLMTKKSSKGRDKMKSRYRMDSRYNIRVKVNAAAYSYKKKPGKEGEEKEADVTVQEVKGVKTLLLVSDERTEGRDRKDVAHKDSMSLYQKMARLYSYLEPVK